MTAGSLASLPAVTGRADHPAIVGRDGMLTYAAFNGLADGLARRLADDGVRAGDRVCLLTPKSPEAIAALVGVLRANAVYVPLDVASPAARLAPMIASADGRWILAGPGSEPIVRRLRQDGVIGPAHAIGWLGPMPPPGIPVAFTLADVPKGAAPPPPARTAADAAHILFTSGSTGRPKGVVVTHGSVLAFVAWASRYFGLREDDRHSGHPPLHFDLSTFDVFGTLGAGATLHLVPPELNLLPHRLADFIRVHALTQWFSVPSALNLLARFDAVAPGDFPSLRRVLWCGEVLPVPTLRYLMERLPHARFTNLYGPTEATIASSFYTVPAVPADDRASIPIGTACDGEVLVVLDADGREALPDTIGELYIGGVGLSPGYWRDPDKTSAAFVDAPAPGGGGTRRRYRTGDLARRDAAGLVHFVGRADTQIKTRGYRVELGEVDAALATVPDVGEAVAVSIDTGGFEGVLIGCAYVAARGATVTPAALRAALATRLPAYMLPARWLALDALPRNPNGKVDRRAVAARFTAGPA